MTKLLYSRLLLLIAAFHSFDTGAALAGNPLERHLVAGPPLRFRSGDTVPREGVFEIGLEPAAGATYGGRVTVEALPAGRYAILVSPAARVEASIPVTDLGVATIDAPGGPLTLQLSGAAAASITIAVMRSE